MYKGTADDNPRNGSKSASWMKLAIIFWGVSLCRIVL